MPDVNSDPDPAYRDWHSLKGSADDERLTRIFQYAKRFLLVGVPNNCRSGTAMAAYGGNG